MTDFINMDKKKTLFLFLGLFLCCNIYSAELEGDAIHRKLINLREAEEPQFVDNYILFTYTSNEKTSFVGVAFDFDNFTKIYRYKRTPDGLYFLVIDNPGKAEIKYRIIVDGLWMADPFNPETVQDINSIELSSLAVLLKADNELDYPYTKNGFTNFYYRGTPGIAVYLVGSFNKWDPFMYLLTEERPGEYFISLKLPPGTYNYYFIAEGEIIHDVKNPNNFYNDDFAKVSVYTLE